MDGLCIYGGGMAENRPRTNVYVDGFNLYYGAVKGTRYKWLDIVKLCRTIFPRNNIQRVLYFTARTRPRVDDPDIRNRQDTYLRALSTCPELTIHYGSFREDKRRMRLAEPDANGDWYATVIKTEEKGSDVNLASWLLRDCFRGEFETAIVVSNDTDLITPIKMVRDEFGCAVGLVNPHKKPAKGLADAATFYRSLRPNAVAACQFPDTLSDARGTFSRPLRWQ